MHVVDQVLLQAFEANRSIAANGCDIIAALEDIGVANCYQRAIRRIVHQLRQRFEHEYARTLGTTSARATLKPRSGSSSSRLKPDTRRGIFG